MYYIVLGIWFHLSNPTLLSAIALGSNDLCCLVNEAASVGAMSANFMVRDVTK